MTNREKYITQCNEYDLLMNIFYNTISCPLRAISGMPDSKRFVRCTDFPKDGNPYVSDCSVCIQKWLNEEAKE